MPDSPQQDTPDLDTQLNALQQQIGDIGVVLDIVIKLRRESYRLLQLLPDELRQLKDQIVRLLPLLPVVALGSVLLTGCVLDLNKLASDLQKPKVVFSTPAAWRCDEQVKLPGKRGIEDCTRCINIARAPEQVTIDTVAHSVPPKGATVLCPTSAVVE